MGLLSYGLSQGENTPKENPYKIGDTLTHWCKKHKVVGFSKIEDCIIIESLVDGRVVTILWFQSDELLGLDKL